MDDKNYFTDGAGHGRTHKDEASSSSSRHTQSSTSSQPEYMTVGTGSQSQYAHALMERLERDSGYGSMASASQFGGGDQAWEDELLVDRPTPAHTPQFAGQSGMSENEKRVLASHVHQLYYNQNRVALAKAIGQTIELLKQLQEVNAKWPAHYPSVQNSQSSEQRSRSPASRPTFAHSQSTRNLDDVARPHGHQHRPTDHFRPSPLRRAETTMPESVAESSSEVERKPREEPRLVTPQIAQEFSILKLDLKVGALSQAELIHSLEKKSIASLLDGKISASVRHLLSLRDRIEDTSSKVLVTGDLNAGKSTFCNALLRRKILPEDQQPCTAIFCEVLDAKENGGVEEVHAVHKEVTYDRNDESTYDIYSLIELEKIVVDNDKYMQCKVFVKDVRSIDESLLNNGVVDIALIDAPGLNADSVKTTAVFARQEEIDVVVFVVSAANHFTLSAKEFIWQAAHEKAYIFMVVNGFDNIRDKERCQKMILEQLRKLSPQTFKEASELVHFVSSNAIPTRPTILEPSGGGGGSGPGGDGDDGSDDSLPSGKHEGSEASGKGKEKDEEKINDFGDLESALRRFVLEKRARSKLAPAKTYLMNCLGDMNVLATVNRDVAQSELDRVSKELGHLEPEYAERTKQESIVSEQLNKEMETTVKDVYDHTRGNLSTTIATVAQADLGIDYPGLFSAFQYAEDLRMAMLDEITAAVRSSEDYGRAATIKSVSMIKSLGLLHVGDSYQNLNFRADMMFSRRKDALARTVDTDVELWDFFDVAGLWERQEKVVGSGMALTIVGTLGTRAIGGMGWVDSAFGAARVLGSRNLQRLAVPTFIAAAVCAVAYVLSTIPQTLPPRLARKLSAQLAEMDYTHSNASRISAEVRRVLKFPSQQLAIDLQKGVEELRQKKEDVARVKQESEVARKYFTNLVRDTSESRRRVEAVDLEGPVPGAAGAYVL
ncbi:mitofusin [Neophaeococcomyces mojaviensis]|uniref:Mitofusin n=1 Tax=Neophaeococcomyces mojaviensis TaxID=3383035 RepID=A0ACC3A769_9EURO|nr:mitofusin [Knufia sp. JES_112]